MRQLSVKLGELVPGMVLIRVPRDGTGSGPHITFIIISRVGTSIVYAEYGHEDKLQIEHLTYNPALHVPPNTVHDRIVFSGIDYILHP